VYPITLEQISPEILLWMPDTASVKTVYEKLKEQNSNLPFPFWAKVWASSKAMVSFLQEEPHFIENKKVLEIGAGIGLPSFSIANKASNIIISDYDKEAVALVHKNVSYLNLSNVTSIVLDWNDIPEHIIANTILLSDTNYNPSDFDALVISITSFINKGSVVILATPNRITANPFLEKLCAFIHKTKNYCIIEGAIEKEIAVFVLKK
jgi:predicted nicotinamide N-methyase